jgi:hypothetical protein
VRNPLRDKLEHDQQRYFSHRDFKLAQEAHLLGPCRETALELQRARKAFLQAWGTD